MRPQPISCGSSAASTTEGTPSRTSGMPNCASGAGDAHVAGGRDLHAGAEHIALDARDHRHRQAAEHVAAAMHQGDEGARRCGIEAGHLVDVGAADEGAFAGAAQHDGTQGASSPPRRSTAAIKSVITAVFSVFSLAGLSIVTTATPRASRCTFTHATRRSLTDCLADRAIPYWVANRNEGNMAIAPQQPHRSWYRHFWYAERSPRDTLADRSLFFAIVALSLVVGGMLLVRHHAVPRGKSPGMIEAAR